MRKNQFDWLEDYDDLFEKKVPSQLLQNPLLQKDIWHTVDDLNLKISPHQRRLTLNFRGIRPDWFKLLVKLYILVRAKPNTPSNTISGFVTYLRGFSQFLAKKSLDNPKQIDNQLFEEFDYYLQAKRLKDSSLGHYRTTICNFFDVSRTEGWLEINTYWFRGKRNRVNPNNDEIDYIPEEVWYQLEQNLHYLPEPIQRMMLAQINRGTETRTNKRPVLADIKDSGDLEQDADLVMLLYRDGYYNSNSSEANVMEINVAKNRNGATGVCKVLCDPTVGKFLTAS